MEKVTSRINNLFKENALYGLQKILLDNFHRNVYIWSAIVNGTCTQEFKIGLKTNIFRRLYFRFTQFYAALNFRSSDFDSSSWRVHLYLVMARVDWAHTCSEKPFPASLKNQHRLCLVNNSVLVSDPKEAAWPSVGFEIRRSRVQIPFWPLADVVLGTPEFNFLATLVNSQLVCLPPVGILNLVMFIWILIYSCLHWSWKAPMGSGQLRILSILTFYIS